jgi:DNA polymerase III subunit beta
MEIRVDRGAFAEEVGWASRVISARPTSPILNGIHISTTEDGQLKLGATDQSASSQTTLEADVVEPGAVVVPGKLLTLIAAALPSQPVHLKTDGTRLMIACGRANFDLPTSPLDGYPPLPEQPDQIGTLAGEEFSDAVMQVVFAAAKDETLPILAGVQVRCTDTDITMLATDRYRLAVKTVPWKGQARDPFLPRAKSLAELAKPSSSDPITLSLDSGNTLFGVTAGSRRSTMPMLDGATYPDVGKLIPAGGTIKVETEIAELIDSVQRVRLVLQRPNQSIRLKFSDGEILIEANGDTDTYASEIIPAKIDGDPMQVAFNPGYLVEGLGALAGETARFQFNGSTRPSLLDAPEDESYRHVLMPVRLEN